MIKVHGGIFSRAGMVMFALEELGQPYEMVDMAPRSAPTRSEEYLALNPNGKLPTLQDGDLTLWETQAILFYLAQKYGDNKLWADSLEQVAEIYRWSLYVSNQLEVPALDMLIQAKYSDGKPDAAVLDKAGGEFRRFLPTLEARLEGRKYVACDHLTVADIHGALVLAWGKLAGFDFSDYPNVNSWIKRMLNHPAQQKLMARARG
ncbi:glutathione S-transferase family protein [Marinobacterium arenosum]|uniref:glutathione S-transferase family protein n=1 Tax=Marinobacterium arenosum TaxID=2862496 RepID=UPI001C9504A8|nr:glutathione S-transferase family protein [Marinobacterium arenosum]MBY4678619.1 glutathione S-transferase family protein [Marinobacterium arenosum]